MNDQKIVINLDKFIQKVFALTPEKYIETYGDSFHNYPLRELPAYIERLTQESKSRLHPKDIREIFKLFKDILKEHFVAETMEILQINQYAYFRGSHKPVIFGHQGTISILSSKKDEGSSDLRLKIYDANKDELLKLIEELETATVVAAS